MRYTIARHPGAVSSNDLLPEAPAETRTRLASVQASAHLRILPETFSAVVRGGIFPPADAGQDHWHRATLDNALEKLLRDGLPPSYRLPYTHEPPRRLVDETVRRHTGWRHGKKSKLIGEPITSPAFVQAWLACERAYAQEQPAQTERDPVLPRKPRSSPPLAPVGAPAAAARQIAYASKDKLPKLANTAPAAAPTVPIGNGAHVYLTPEELCERWRWRITPETLANHRAMKIGLPYCKFGKVILYRLDLVEEYEQQHLILPD